MGATTATAAPGAGPGVIDMTGQRIPFRDRVVLKPGQSAVLHGARGPCGEEPLPWSAARWQLPPLAIGIWSDGGVGYRISNASDGPTPAKAVVLIATQPGEERLVLFNDPVVIRIEE